MASIGKILIGDINIDKGIYITKGYSPLANPFVIQEHETREEITMYYKGWLELQIRQCNKLVCAELNRIADFIIRGEDVTLLINPGDVHGQIIRDTIYNAIKGE